MGAGLGVGRVPGNVVPRSGVGSGVGSTIMSRFELSFVEELLASVFPKLELPMSAFTLVSIVGSGEGEASTVSSAVGSGVGVDSTNEGA